MSIVLVDSCGCRTYGIETRRSRVQCHPLLYYKFKANPGYLTLQFILPCKQQANIFKVKNLNLLS